MSTRRRACTPITSTPQSERVAKYRDALALAFAADPADKTYASQLKGGAMLEALFRRQPDHPGLAHDIIHIYDAPALADHAFEAAERYAKIAPSASHALHMPSHTFTRIGYWQESIDANVASAESARREGATSEELHASDYQTYAYLQTAQDRAARRVVDSVPAMVSRFDPNAMGAAAPPSAGFFAIATIPARYALERGAWSEAAALEQTASPFPFADAMTQFARAIGAARTGNIAAARAAVGALQRLREALASQDAYWAEQVEIQRLGASAWLAFADERRDEALSLMRSAVEREDRTEKNAITPGPLAPARELLGDLLLQMREPAAAVKEYVATLRKEPNRFRSLYGAAHAAALAGDRAGAKRSFTQLLKVCRRSDKPGRPELAEARAFR